MIYGSHIGKILNIHHADCKIDDLANLTITIVFKNTVVFT
jgi:hypothetical protein